MRKELTEKLIDSFPYIINPDNIGLQWGTGIDCGNGWYELLYELLEKIEDIYKKNNKSIADFKIDQIKEKYGTLRFYASTEFPEVYNLIQEYEDKSENICEDCDKFGSLHIKNGYLLTLCDECAEKKGFTKAD